MRSIKFKNGKWLGYNGKELIELDSQEDAIEWRNSGVLPKKSYAEPVEGETTSFFVPSEMLPDNGNED